jgi:hypothetical protein
VLSDRGLCDGPIPRPEESYRLRCVSECDQLQINNLGTYCEQVGRRGKDYEIVTSPYPTEKVLIIKYQQLNLTRLAWLSDVHCCMFSITFEIFRHGEK